MGGKKELYESHNSTKGLRSSDLTNNPAPSINNPAVSKDNTTIPMLATQHIFFTVYVWKYPKIKVTLCTVTSYETIDLNYKEYRAKLNVLTPLSK